MVKKNTEVFIPGPAGRIQAKYLKSEKKGAPIALILLSAVLENCLALTTTG